MIENKIIQENLKDEMFSKLMIKKVILLKMLNIMVFIRQINHLYSKIGKGNHFKRRT